MLGAGSRARCSLTCPGRVLHRRGEEPAALRHDHPGPLSAASKHEESERERSVTLSAYAYTPIKYKKPQYWSGIELAYSATDGRYQARRMAVPQCSAVPISDRSTRRPAVS
eukprot:765106-Rhodomonas_salina.1